MDNKSAYKTQKLLAVLPPIVKEYYYSVLYDKSELTALHYISYISSFIDSRFCRNSSNEFYKYVTPADIQNYIDASVGGNSIKASEYTAFNSFFTFLCNNDYIAKNPVAQVKRASTNNIELKSLSRTLTCSDLCNIINAIKNSSDRHVKRNIAIIYLIVAEGLKVGTIINLNLNNYNSTTGELIFNDSNMSRIKILCPNSRAAIDSWLNYRRSYFTTDDPALFISATNQRLTDEGVRKMIRNNLKDAHLDAGLTSENFRTTMANGFLKIGYPIESIREYLGHKDSRATYQLLDSLEKNESGPNAEEERQAIMQILGNETTGETNEQMVSYEEYMTLKMEYEELKAKYDAFMEKYALILLLFDKE